MNFWYVALACAAILALWILIRAATVRQVVWDGMRAVQRTRGQFRREVGPGAYWGLRGVHHFTLIDFRPQVLTVSGQEVLGADGITYRVSLTARWRVLDARLALESCANYNEEIYLEMQLGLREVVIGLAVEEVLEKRSQFGPAILAIKAPRLKALGVELLAVDVKDVMVPGEMRRVLAEAAKARKEGLAALERARAETATLRHLANAATLLERNPTLMQLRALLTIEGSTGNSVVMNITPPPAKETPLA